MVDDLILPQPQPRDELLLELVGGVVPAEVYASRRLAPIRCRCHRYLFPTVHAAVPATVNRDAL
jgi:hypothetical protein